MSMVVVWAYLSVATKVVVIVIVGMVAIALVIATVVITVIAEIMGPSMGLMISLVRCHWFWSSSGWRQIRCFITSMLRRRLFEDGRFSSSFVMTVVIVMGMIVLD